MFSDIVPYMVLVVTKTHGTIGGVMGIVTFPKLVRNFKCRRDTVRRFVAFRDLVEFIHCIRMTFSYI